MRSCALCHHRPLRPAWRLPHFFACARCRLIHHLRSEDRQQEEARYEGVIFDTPAAVAAQQWRWLHNIARGAIRPGQRVLDIGCGSGSFLVQAHGQGLQVAGLDISEAAIARARERLGGDCELVAGSLEGARFEEGFDFVTLWDVLDHLDNPRPVLTRIHQLLRPGGVVAVRVRNGPVHLTLRALETRVRAWLRRPPRGDYLGVVHRYGFDVQNLRRLLAEEGFASTVQPTDVTAGDRDRTTGAGSWIRPLKAALVAAAESAGRLSGYRIYPAPSLLLAARPVAALTEFAEERR